MSHEHTNGMITLKKNESLQLFQREKVNILHWISPIKAIQEIYDKKITFQVCDSFNYVQYFISMSHR